MVAASLMGVGKKQTILQQLAWGLPLVTLWAIIGLWGLILYHRLMWGGPN